MGHFEVLQRTKDGMFNATHFLKQWNSTPGNPKRDLSKFWEQHGVKDFIDILMQEESLDTPSEVYVKSRASRGSNAGTWMHPYLYTKFIMWVNPVFEYHVIKLVSDQLIEFRHQAGDFYRFLGRAAGKFKDANYAQIAIALNHIVFGKHDSELRQQATPEQLAELTDVQKKLAFAVDMGYIKTFDCLINELRKIYQHKWNYQPANGHRRLTA